MTRLLRRIDLLAMILAMLAGGLAGSQLSEFMQQYTQNLAGRRAEAQHELRGLVERASEAQIPLGAYMSRFAGSADPIFAQEGQAMQARVERATELDEAWHEIRYAGMLAKPFVFCAHLDTGVAADVWRHYRPAVPLDSASLLYSVLLMAIAALGYRVAVLIVGLPVRIVSRRRGNAARPQG